MVSGLICVALASWALRELWMHEDSFLASGKAQAEVMDGWLGNLLNCRFCLAFHASLWIPPALLLAHELLPAYFGFPFYWLLIALASTGMILLIDRAFGFADEPERQSPISSTKESDDGIPGGHP